VNRLSPAVTSVCRRSAHGDDDALALFGALKPFIPAYTEEEDQGR